jgi:hypothetical protein
VNGILPGIPPQFIRRSFYPLAQEGSQLFLLADLVHHGDHGVRIAPVEFKPSGIFLFDQAFLEGFHGKGDGDSR